MDIRRPCGYYNAAITRCSESDIRLLVRCHHLIHSNGHPENLPSNYLTTLAGVWNGIFGQPDSIVFKAHCGSEIIGFAYGRRNSSDDSELCQFDGAILLVNVLEKARRCAIGRRLLSCIAANLFSGGMRNAFVSVHIDDTTSQEFIKFLGGKFYTVKIESDTIIYVWSDLLPLILDVFDA